MGVEIYLYMLAHRRRRLAAETYRCKRNNIILIQTIYYCFEALIIICGEIFHNIPHSII